MKFSRDPEGACVYLAQIFRVPDSLLNTFNTAKTCWLKVLINKGGMLIPPVVKTVKSLLVVFIGWFLCLVPPLAAAGADEPLFVAGEGHRYRAGCSS